MSMMITISAAFAALGASAAEVAETIPSQSEATLAWDAWSIGKDIPPDSLEGALKGLTQTDSSVPGVAFICSSENGLKAVASLNEGDLKEKLLDPTDRIKTRSVTLLIDGERVSRETWLFKPDVQTVQPLQPSTNKTIYNAIILGQTVTVKLGSRDPVELTLPAIDDEFRAFAASCPITKRDA